MEEIHQNKTQKSQWRTVEKYLVNDEEQKAQVQISPKKYLHKNDTHITSLADHATTQPSRYNSKSKDTMDQSSYKADPQIMIQN